MDGGVDGGNIRTAVIYKDDQELRLEEPNESINGLVFENNLYHIGKNPLRLFVDNPTYSGTRKPTIWLFRWKDEQFLVMGVHLLSQSSNSPDWGNIHPISMPDQAKREKQSGLISEYFSQTGLMATQPNIIIAGDFNDYEWSNTLKVLKSTQMLAILSDKQPEKNYSYIHEGNAFEIDYVFVNQKLLTRIKQFSIPHINTIMNSEDQVSDHDPVLVTIMPLD
jgi:predicted extracellular nuclease